MYHPSRKAYSVQRIDQALNSIKAAIADESYTTAIISKETLHLPVYHVYSDATNPAIIINGGGIIFRENQAIHASFWELNKGWLALKVPESLEGFNAVAAAEMLAAYTTIKNCDKICNCRIILHMDNAEGCFLLIRTFDHKLSMAESIMTLFHKLCAERKIMVAVS